MTWPKVAAGLSVDPGPETTWSTGGELHTEPAAVAVDSSGRARACGSQAIQAAGRKGAGLRLCHPFTSTEVMDVDLSRAYLRWLVERARCLRRRLPLMIVIPAETPARTAAVWGDLARSIGAEPMVVQRPVAAVAGLGLATASGIAHLVVEAEPDATELAVVVDGLVVASQVVPPLPTGLDEAADVVRSFLVSIDPDHEIDIADQGINLVGRRADYAFGKAFAADVGLAVNIPDRPEAVVIEGARRAMEAIRPYLDLVTGRAGPGLRGVRGAV